MVHKYPQTRVLWLHYIWYQSKLGPKFIQSTPTVAWTRVWLGQRGGGYKRHFTGHRLSRTVTNEPLWNA